MNTNEPSLPINRSSCASAMQEPITFDIFGPDAKALTDSTACTPVDGEYTGDFVHISQPEHVNDSKIISKFGSLTASSSHLLRTPTCRIVSLPTPDQEAPTTIMTVPLSNSRIVSMPSSVNPAPFASSNNMDSPTSSFKDSSRSFDVSSTEVSLESDRSHVELGSARKSRSRTRRESFSMTPSPPSSPDSVVIVYRQSPLSDTFLKDIPRLNTDAWGMSEFDSPKPIPALHGPTSLPYARCPSGAEGLIIEKPEDPTRAVWGLKPDRSLRPHATILSTAPTLTHAGGNLPARLPQLTVPMQQNVVGLGIQTHSQNRSGTLDSASILKNAKSDNIPSFFKPSHPVDPSPEAQSLLSYDSLRLLQQRPGFRPPVPSTRTSATPSTPYSGFQSPASGYEILRQSEIVLEELRKRAVPFVPQGQPARQDALPPAPHQPQVQQSMSFTPYPTPPTPSNAMFHGPGGLPVIDLSYLQMNRQAATRSPLINWGQSYRAPLTNPLPTPPCSTELPYVPTFTPSRNSPEMQRSYPQVTSPSEPSVAHFSRSPELLEVRRPASLRQQQQHRVVSDPLAVPWQARPRPAPSNLQQSNVPASAQAHVRSSSFRENVYSTPPAPSLCMDELARKTSYLDIGTGSQPTVLPANVYHRRNSSASSRDESGFGSQAAPYTVSSMPHMNKSGLTSSTMDATAPALRKPMLPYQAPRSVPMSRLVQKRLPSVPEESANVEVSKAQGEKVLRTRGPSITDPKGFVGRSRMRAPAPAPAPTPVTPIEMEAKKEDLQDGNLVEAKPTNPSPSDAVPANTATTDSTLIAETNTVCPAEAQAEVKTSRKKQPTSRRGRQQSKAMNTAQPTENQAATGTPVESTTEPTETQPAATAPANGDKAAGVVPTRRRPAKRAPRDAKAAAKAPTVDGPAPIHGKENAPEAKQEVSAPTKRRRWPKRPKASGERQGAPASAPAAAA